VAAAGGESARCFLPRPPCGLPSPWPRGTEPGELGAPPALDSGLGRWDILDTVPLHLLWRGTTRGEAAPGACGSAPRTRAVEWVPGEELSDLRVSCSSLLLAGETCLGCSPVGWQWLL
jgi:hypothetical protein